MPPACRPVAMRCDQVVGAQPGVQKVSPSEHLVVSSGHETADELGGFSRFGQLCFPRDARAHRARMQSPTPWTTDGTRGGALDATLEVKTQAVILTWKQIADGVSKMAAYKFAAEATGNHVSTVRRWVQSEEKEGVDALTSKRENCGNTSKFSPGKKAKLDEFLESAKRQPNTLEELWQALQAAWKEDLTEDKIECAYRLLTPVMALIADNNGGNAFKLPHTRIRKEMRADGWDI